MNIKLCENCKSIIDETKISKYQKKSERFCSRKCANTYSSNELKNNPRTKIVNCFKCNSSVKVDIRAPKNRTRCYICSHTNNCKWCGVEFLYKRHRLYCSKNCVSLYYKSPEYVKIMSEAIKGKSGGYREGSGNSKTGYYKGIYCGSTYELVWIIYRLDNNLFVKRFEGYLKDPKTNLMYCPDFISEDNSTIYEIKGYWNKKVDLKTDLAIKNGYKVELLYKNDLKTHFDWVKSKYKYNNIVELYDKYKPKYEYTCKTCDKQIFTDKKRKTSDVFCSRSCSGKNLKNY